MTRLVEVCCDGADIPAPNDIEEPLLTSDEALRHRGEMELNTVKRKSSASHEGIYQPDRELGQQGELSNVHLGPVLHGKVVRIEHRQIVVEDENGLVAVGAETDITCEVRYQGQLG